MRRFPALICPYQLLMLEPSGFVKNGAQELYSLPGQGIHISLACLISTSVGLGSRSL